MSYGHVHVTYIRYKHNVLANQIMPSQHLSGITNTYIIYGLCYKVTGILNTSYIWHKIEPVGHIDIAKFPVKKPTFYWFFIWIIFQENIRNIVWGIGCNMFLHKSVDFYQSNKTNIKENLEFCVGHLMSKLTNKLIIFKIWSR